MKKPVFTGAAVAIITPMHADGSVNYDELGRIIDDQIAHSTDAIVICGTTGESPTLTDEEHTECIRYTVKKAAGRVPMIAGTGSNDTKYAIWLSQQAEADGADALLLVTPYYNKATQRGLVRHFTAVADAVDRPLIVYNVPSRTGVSCTAETYAVLAQHPNIVGVKEASGSFALIQETLNLCGDGFSVWSGNDEDTAAVCALGGAGVISVAANIVPREMHRLVELCLADRILEAGREQLRLAPLIRALFCEVNPIPVKTAMARMGLCSDLLRLPLCEMSEENRARLFAAMDACGIDA